MMHDQQPQRDLPLAERQAWLRLARSEGVGPVTFAKLLEHFGTAARALAALPELQRRGGWPVRRVASLDEVEGEVEGLSRLGGTMLLSGEADYPPPLREIADAPPVLTVLGGMEVFAQPAVAVIGARNASANGCLFARRLAAELATAGFTIVSGLARGIDTAAHHGALDAGGLTVAVIAAGVDIAYPPENEALMARIAGTGAVVSERPLGATARAKDFPRRNRIISGLSLGVVVVEAAPQSGSLITARLAAEQGREVLAVPGSPLDPRHRGANQLLREGAQLVENAADVLAVLQPGAQRIPRRPPSPRRSERPAADTMPRLPPEPTPASSQAIHLKLGAEPLALDELVRQCGLPLMQVQDALLDLELEGRLDRHPGNRVALRAG